MPIASTKSTKKSVKSISALTIVMQKTQRTLGQIAFMPRIVHTIWKKHEVMKA